MRRVLLLLLACALALTLVPLAATRASRDGEAGSLAQQARAVERQLAGLERQVAGMERSSGRFDRWLGCIRWMPVSEYGDADARDGYRYDDQDGSGPGYRAALAVDTARPRQPDFMLLSLRRRAGCDSSPTLPGGTAEPATLGGLERRLARLDRRVGRVERMSERFDEWESCLSWVPVTEHGDAGERFGYLFGPKHDTTPRYRAALAIDTSPWDDPDYELLAFAGRNRPFAARECSGDPGEGVD